MSQIVSGEVITINGKEYKLLFPVGAAIAFRDKTGKNILKGFNPADLTEEEGITLLWAQLLHLKDPLLTEEYLMWADIGPALDDKTVKTVIDSLPEIKGESPKKAARRSRG